VNRTSAKKKFASVIVRSYNRLEACVELLQTLFTQDYDNFEVIVIEQSTTRPPETVKILQLMEQREPRLRVIQTPPLGPAGARNLGCRKAEGEILLFIDDDDLPADKFWIASHVANYSDPDIIGVNGRDIYEENEHFNYKYSHWAHKHCCRYNMLGYAHCYARLNERVEGVDWLRGGNSSIRKKYVELAGEWDERMEDHEEHSFSLKLKKVLKHPERIVFDPGPTVLRRNWLPGGLDRRNMAPKKIYWNHFRHYHVVIAKYMKARFMVFLPFYPFWILGLTIRYIWDDSRLYQSVTGKLLATLNTLLCSPYWYFKSWWKLFRGN